MGSVPGSAPLLQCGCRGRRPPAAKPAARTGPKDRPWAVQTGPAAWTGPRGPRVIRQWAGEGQGRGPHEPEYQSPGFVTSAWPATSFWPSRLFGEVSIGRLGNSCNKRCQYTHLRRFSQLGAPQLWLLLQLEPQMPDTRHSMRAIRILASARSHSPNTGTASAACIPVRKWPYFLAHGSRQD